MEPQPLIVLFPQKIETVVYVDTSVVDFHDGTPLQYVIALMNLVRLFIKFTTCTWWYRLSLMLIEPTSQKWKNDRKQSRRKWFNQRYIISSEFSHFTIVDN